MSWTAMEAIERAVGLLAISVFCGVIFTAIYALVLGSRLFALTSLVLALLPVFVCSLSRGSFWETYGGIWTIGLVCSVAAMIRACCSRRQTAPVKPPGGFI